MSARGAATGVSTARSPTKITNRHHDNRNLAPPPNNQHSRAISDWFALSFLVTILRRRSVLSFSEAHCPSRGLYGIPPHRPSIRLPWPRAALDTHPRRPRPRRAPIRDSATSGWCRRSPAPAMYFSCVPDCATDTYITGPGPVLADPAGQGRRCLHPTCQRRGDAR